MATVARISVSWQGWPGAPGVSQFYASTSSLQATVDALRAFFQAQNTLIPTGLTITVPGSGDTLDDATGNLVGTWSVTTPPVIVTGSGAGAYAGNAGAVVHWLTAAVINGRRLRGRTFMVPLVASAYDTSGSISTAALATITGAANTLLSATLGFLLVWHRPVPPAAGSTAAYNAVRVPDLAVSLRSRRI